MTCQELKELAGAFAAGALDPEERAACEAHLQTAAHDGCFEALAAAEDAVAAGLAGSLAPVAPDPAVWERIAAGVGGSAQVTPIEARRRRPWVAMTGWVVAAAAAAAALVMWQRGAGDLEEARGRVRQEQTRVSAGAALLDRCSKELAQVRASADAEREALAIAELPGSKLVTLAPQGEAQQRATALVHVASGRAVVMSRGLLPQAGKDYELWIIRGDQKIAAGLLRAGQGGRLAVVVDPRLLAAGVDAIAITLEPEGGGEQPRGPILLVSAV